jgi:hypothetical protein
LIGTAGTRPKQPVRAIERRYGHTAAMYRTAGVLAVLLLSAACGLFRSAAAAPGTLTRAISGGGDAPVAPDRDAQQQAVERLAMLAINGVHLACDDFAAAVGTPAAQLEAARWSVRTTETLLLLATQSEAIPALLEIIISLRLRSHVVEDLLIPRHGEAARQMSATLATLEQEAWNTFGRMVDPKRAAAARKAIDEWAMGLGKLDEQTLLQRPALDEVLKPQASDEGGFWSWLEIDPFAGLEPAAREVAMMRLFAQRALFYAQHLPRLLSDEVQLAALEARGQTEVKDLLAAVERATVATASIGKLADELPGLVHSEREAAIRQVGAEFEAQRRGLVTDLEQARAPLTQLLDSSRATLGATDAAAQQLTTLVTAVDRFVARFDRPEAGAATTAPAPAATGASPPPFDITAYGETATRLADAARELTALVTQLDRTLPELQRTIDQTGQRADATVSGAITKALWAGLFLIAATAVAILAVRRFGRRSEAAVPR